jgi:hypothetical protein
MMEAVVLALTLYCGVPVSVFFTFPDQNGRTYHFDRIEVERRKFWLDLALKVEALPTGVVHRIKVEERVEGLKCPVSS